MLEALLARPRVVHQPGPPGPRGLPPLHRLVPRRGLRVRGLRRRVQAAPRPAPGAPRGPLRRPVPPPPRRGPGPLPRGPRRPGPLHRPLPGGPPGHHLEGGRPGRRADHAPPVQDRPPPPPPHVRAAPGGPGAPAPALGPGLPPAPEVRFLALQGPPPPHGPGRACPGAAGISFATPPPRSSPPPGTDVATIGRMLGHRPGSPITLRYLHTDDGRLREAAEAVARAVQARVGEAEDGARGGVPTALYGVQGPSQAYWSVAETLGLDGARAGLLGGSPRALATPTPGTPPSLHRDCACWSP